MDYTYSDLKKLFTSVCKVVYPDGAPYGECHYCRNNEEIKRCKTEKGGWSHTFYCPKCNQLNYVTEADRMTGNFEETATVFKGDKE